MTLSMASPDAIFQELICQPEVYFYIAWNPLLCIILNFDVTQADDGLSVDSQHKHSELIPSIYDLEVLLLSF